MDKLYRLTRKYISRAVVDAKTATTTTYKLNEGDIFRIVEVSEGVLPVPEKGVWYVTNLKNFLIDFRDRIEEIVTVAQPTPTPEQLAEPEKTEQPAKPQEMEPEEASEPGPEETVFERVYNLSVNEVLNAVHKGDLNAEKALAAEQEGKQRKTLIIPLEEMLQGGANL